jgi:hypothetical protein
MSSTVLTAPVMTAPVMIASPRPAMSDRDATPAEAVPAMSHLGPLGDTDLAKELAQLTALQNRQALGGDSPSGLNRAPQTLLSLFSQA